MRSITLDALGDNLVIHDVYFFNGFLVQMPLQGFDSPEMRMTEYDNPGEDGARVTSQNYGGRLITIQGMMQGSDANNYDYLRRALTSATSIRRDQFGNPVAKRCQCVTDNGVSFFVDGYFKRPVFDLTHINHTRFMIQLVVPSPFIYEETPQSSGAITRASGGGFILPVILPIVSTAAIGGNVELNNQGTGYSYPIITLTGPLTNPYINNATEDKSMQLTYTINSGDEVIIDMAEKSIMLNGTSPLLSTKTSDSDWWTLAPGFNDISFSTGSSSDTGNMQVEYYNSYIGI